MVEHWLVGTTFGCRFDLGQEYLKEWIINENEVSLGWIESEVFCFVNEIFRTQLKELKLKANK